MTAARRLNAAACGTDRGLSGEPAAEGSQSASAAGAEPGSSVATSTAAAR